MFTIAICVTIREVAIQRRDYAQVYFTRKIIGIEHVSPGAMGASKRREVNQTSSPPRTFLNES
jgi:hypothetical protein